MKSYKLIIPKDEKQPNLLTSLSMAAFNYSKAKGNQDVVLQVHFFDNGLKDVYEQRQRNTIATVGVNIELFEYYLLSEYELYDEKYKNDDDLFLDYKVVEWGFNFESVLVEPSKITTK